MSKEEQGIQAHPLGEVKSAENQAAETVTSLDTFAGKVYVKWSPEATVSSLGLMPFFIEFLKTSGLFDKWVEDCPLHYTSANAPEKRNVLGTLLLSVLAGHWRYAHINAIRGDGVNPELLGMTKVASEDSVRRAMKALDEDASAQWMKEHLKASYFPAQNSFFQRTDHRLEVAKMKNRPAVVLSGSHVIDFGRFRKISFCDPLTPFQGGAGCRQSRRGLPTASSHRHPCRGSDGGRVAASGR
jgi:hypothetical protein